MFDYVIIGAGIIGILTARRLRKSGASVLLLDKGAPGSESSWAGGGILSPLYPWRYPDAVSRLANWSQHYYPSLCNEIKLESGIDPEYESSGLLILDTRERAQAETWARSFYPDLKLIERAEIAALEPALNPPADEALWLPGIGQVRNPRLVRALSQCMVRLGIEVRKNASVDRIEVSGQSAVAVRVGGERIPGGRFIVTAGAWTGVLLESLGTRLPVKPVRGQMLVFRAVPGLVQHIILNQGRYLIPRRDGHVLIGSTLEDVGFDKATTEDAYAELHECALQMVPDLARYPVERHWSGLRPGSPEGIPFIGKHPNINNIYINAGHFRNGVVLGPASVELLVDELLACRPILDPTPYALVS